MIFESIFICICECVNTSIVFGRQCSIADLFHFFKKISRFYFMHNLYLRHLIVFIMFFLQFFGFDKIGRIETVFCKYIIILTCSSFLDIESRRIYKIIYFNQFHKTIFTSILYCLIRSQIILLISCHLDR